MSSRSSRDTFGCNFFDWLLLQNGAISNLIFFREKWPLKVTWPNLRILLLGIALNFESNYFTQLSFVSIGLNPQNIDYP